MLALLSALSVPPPRLWSEMTRTALGVRIDLEPAEVAACIDEVTKFFEGIEDITQAVHRVNTEADVIWVDGHSDYGHAFEVFWERYGKDVGPKTTILLLGDARNNYHSSQSWIIKAISSKARSVFWLNPEPRSYWNTGDSIVGDYGTHTDGVFECRNLRQLEKFVDYLA